MDNEIVAVKVFQVGKYDPRELTAGKQLRDYNDDSIYPFLVLEYANMKTLDIVAKQTQFSLPSFALRALMKQILEGIRSFHAAGFIHRDIKTDNILLNSPPGSGQVHIKISDFGFAKQDIYSNEITYFKGTLSYMGPELTKKPLVVTQKVDMYAIGITFYHLITHKYPHTFRTYKELQTKMAQLKCIERPSELKDNLLWNLLSQLLEFDPNKRISAEVALKHSFFTGEEAKHDLTPEQQ
ncbi:MAG: putative serine/threonine protein kinase [Streblomastix strix]|uniref:Putative serine/threonine protein kinase n=1 Tax=Streblomastix strix TaxID=222440 RepID=A0A5J4VYP5_9EUKA|nr:MAG: putative serine/threonine protein kinase [Streblomastix strix]